MYITNSITAKLNNSYKPHLYVILNYVFKNFLSVCNIAGTYSASILSIFFRIIILWVLKCLFCNCILFRVEFTSRYLFFTCKSFEMEFSVSEWNSRASQVFSCTGWPCTKIYLFAIPIVTQSISSVNKNNKILLFYMYSHTAIKNIILNVFFSKKKC